MTDKIPLAIAYDFDGTLAPGNMQEHSFIPELGIELKHYIISSGLREMIQASKIGSEFEYIWASGFMYDDDGKAIWPALAINYTTKTQYLFRINKGVLNSFENDRINSFAPDEHTAKICFHVLKAALADLVKKQV